MSSLALLRVSARTDLDIIFVSFGNLNFLKSFLSKFQPNHETHTHKQSRSNKRDSSKHGDIRYIRPNKTKAKKIVLYERSQVELHNSVTDYLLFFIDDDDEKNME